MYWLGHARHDWTIVGWYLLHEIELCTRSPILRLLPPEHYKVPPFSDITFVELGDAKFDRPNGLKLGRSLRIPGDRIRSLGPIPVANPGFVVVLWTRKLILISRIFFVDCLEMMEVRATGQEYDTLMREFMCAVKQNYGEKVLIQFEDFANHNAFELLAKYRKTHLVFNDDIQGTTSVVLAGIDAAMKLVGGALNEHTFLFYGGEAGTGIAELIALQMSNRPLKMQYWALIKSLQSFKKPWAHDHEPIDNLVDAVKAIKPTFLIGSSGRGKSFTKETIEAMSSINKKPVILALSNPTPQSECTAEEAYKWSKGNVIFASGSPFKPVEYNGKTFVPSQSNNAYIFPGFGLGVVISGAIRVHDDMILAASGQVTKEMLGEGMIYPPITIIRKISAHCLASHLPQPKNLLQYAESCMYSPLYRTYR
ncbi:malate dehydrogenase (oxaloacetate-decarboxylating) (NADP(+)) [Ranunculus cassubicifolius]